MSNRPKIAISACLMGKSVRHNGGHTNDRWLLEELSQFVDYYFLCPEMEMKLGVPREEIFLVYSEEKGGPSSLYGRKSGKDYTQLARDTYSKINRRIRDEELVGIVLMRKSPSCGPDNVKAVSRDGEGPVKLLTGLFAESVQEHLSDLPKIDSGRIKNADLREHFIKQIFALHRFNQISTTIKDLQDFHRRYKYILMEHSQSNLKLLGGILANHDSESIEQIRDKYLKLFLETLAEEATVKNRVNTLFHIFGYFKKYLESKEKADVISLINEYAEGSQSYRTPLEIMKYFVTKYKVNYLSDHYYFDPYPKELKVHKHL